MAWTRPTLPELRARSEADFAFALTGSATPLKRALIRVIAAVQAGLAHMLYGFLAWIVRQIFADTADEENLYRIGEPDGVVPTEASFAEGPVVFTGDDGSVIPADTVLLRSDGVEYVLQADVTIATGTGTGSLTCSTEGQTGNLDAAETLQLQSPIAGVSSTATVDAGGISGGADAETPEEYLARYLEFKRTPPQGGAESDYKIWAKEVAGVTEAWVYPTYLGPGTVGVSFIRGNDASVIPDAGEVAAVQAHIDEKAPVTADVTVFAPTAVAIAFTIGPEPSTAAVKAAIEAELTDLLKREGEPGGTILLSHIQEAISTAAGETDHTLTVPAADVVLAFGQYPIMGVITWT